MSDISDPSKIFVECSITFYDVHLTPVAQRKTHVRTTYFRLIDGKYVLDFHLNTRDPLIQKEFKIENDMSICIAITITRAFPSLKASARSLVVVAIPPFQPTKDSETMEIPAMYNTFADNKPIRATFHHIIIKRDDIAEGIHVELSLADMREFLANMNMIIAQFMSAMPAKP